MRRGIGDEPQACRVPFLFGWRVRHYFQCVPLTQWQPGSVVVVALDPVILLLSKLAMKEARLLPFMYSWRQEYSEPMGPSISSNGFLFVPGLPRHFWFCLCAAGNGRGQSHFSKISAKFKFDPLCGELIPGRIKELNNTAKLIEKYPKTFCSAGTLVNKFWANCQV